MASSSSTNQHPMNFSSSYRNPEDCLDAVSRLFWALCTGYGPAGYALFVAVYAGLEVLAIPTIPFTMSAGILFGPLTGTIPVSISGTLYVCPLFKFSGKFSRIPDQEVQRRNLYTQ
ncbi:hypothetical protein Ccrd_020500, partial [Cynara cardunculus var. scolymus]